MYTVSYDSRVLEDLEKINVSTRKRIRKSIESRLTTQPEMFGKPLRQSLAGFRVLRVGDHRIVFLIKHKEVLIFLIGNREYIYKEAQKRFG